MVVSSGNSSTLESTSGPMTREPPTELQLRSDPMVARVTTPLGASHSSPHTHNGATITITTAPVHIQARNRKGNRVFTACCDIPPHNPRDGMARLVRARHLRHKTKPSVCILPKRRMFLGLAPHGCFFLVCSGL